MNELPESAPQLDAARLNGAWYVLISNHGFWRTRTHPRVEHEVRVGGPANERVSSLRTTLRFRQPDLLGRVQRKAIHGTDSISTTGEHRWRGEGFLRVLECPWCVPLIDPDSRWAVAWFGRTNLGMAGGLGIHTRDPSVPQVLLDEILAELRAHPFLASRSEGLYATEQDWIPPEPYRLE